MSSDTFYDPLRPLWDIWWHSPLLTHLPLRMSRNIWRDLWVIFCISGVLLLSQCFYGEIKITCKKFAHKMLLKLTVENIFINLPPSSGVFHNFCFFHFLDQNKAFFYPCHRIDITKISFFTMDLLWALAFFIFVKGKEGYWFYVLTFKFNI